MRLLLDDMLSPTIARVLRERGRDAQAVAEHPGHQGLTDREVLDVARTQRRALVTNNLLDFRPLHHEAIAPGGPGHYGMVFVPGTCRRTKADVGRIAAALEVKLARFRADDDLAGRETWL